MHGILASIFNSTVENNSQQTSSTSTNTMAVKSIYKIPKSTFGIL
jgi:hypothetical protein